MCGLVEVNCVCYIILNMFYLEIYIIEFGLGNINLVYILCLHKECTAIIDISLLLEAGRNVRKILIIVGLSDKIVCGMILNILYL